jgi:hypothetical protein
MRHFVPTLIAAVLVAIPVPASAGDPLTDLPTYAEDCWTQLGLTQAQIKANLRGKTFDCKRGTPLPVVWTSTGAPTVHINLDLWSVSHPAPTMWPINLTREDAPPLDFPPGCDKPAWLTEKCYGHSYIQQIPTGRKEVRGILLCRHKYDWIGLAARANGDWVIDDGSGHAKGTVGDTGRLQVGDAVTILVGSGTFYPNTVNAITGTTITLGATTPGKLSAGDRIAATTGWVTTAASDFAGNAGKVSNAGRFQVGDNVTIFIGTEATSNDPAQYLARKITAIAGDGTFTFDATVASVKAGANIAMADMDGSFDDVAIILHSGTSDGNGNTCFFQSRLDGTRLDGRNVPSPGNTNWATFWKNPTETAAVKCGNCHDNGAWMTSYWLRDYMASIKLKDDNWGYKAPGDAFAFWKKDLNFTDYTVLKKAFDPSGAERCDTCHAIGAKRASCNRWINFVTGGGPDHNAPFSEWTSDYGLAWKQSGWMPPGGYDTSGEWDTAYKTHVQKLLLCCANPKADDCVEKSCAGNGTFPGAIAGCIPPDKTIARCEDKLATASSKLLVALVTCHRKRAKGGSLADENTCETKALTAFDTKTASLGGCPSCADLATIKSTIESSIAADNGDVFCEGTVPFGGDETGFIPDAAAKGCEDKLAQADATLLKARLNCRRKLARRGLADDLAEQACEAKATTKFDSKTAALSGCPACAVTNLATIKAETDTLLDDGNGLVYCASPSGAFLDETL